LSGNLARANSAYAESYQAFYAAGSEARRLLESPRRLIYRPPAISITRLRPQNPDDYVVRSVEMRLKIGKDGKVQDAVVFNSTAPENSNRAALLAARKARFAPRIENGQPVETENVAMVERLLIRVERQTPPTN
jgi:TonB family protein